MAKVVDNGFSQRLERGFEYSVRHCGLQVKNDGGHAWPHDKWEVTIDGETFDYCTGTGHRKPRMALSVSMDERTPYHDSKLWLDVKWVDRWRAQMEQQTRVVPPPIDDVLYSLLSDAQAGQAGSFEEFCSEFGYDTDSRRILAMYLECQRTATRLRDKLRIDIDAAGERFQDY